MSGTISGTSGNDWLRGSTPPNSLYYKIHRDDSIDGGAGNDNIWGFGGNDELIGGSGNDYIYGGDGDDYIIGVDRYGGGNYGEIDVLTGGDGRDTFVLGTSARAYYQMNDNFAIIRDFDSYEGDRLQVTGSSSDYFFAHGNFSGNSDTDTFIFYRGNVIAYLQDFYTSSTYMSDDFTFV